MGPFSRAGALCLFVVALVTTSPFVARAAFKSSNAAVTPEQACNPNPLADDIILPMPCGLNLALRAVDVPAGALIRDKTFAMGVNSTHNSDRQLYERQFAGHIAAPFTINDLPPGWKKLVASGEGDAWYFIGKYEVSNLQWRSVMDAVNSHGEEDSGLCPSSIKGANLPVSGITWFEAQEFLNKYNAWLVRNHLSSLPAFGGTQNIAFLRLPTEEEWEYAARGGAKVPPEWWQDQDIFPFAKDAELNDYGVFNHGTTLNGPAGIGSRNANPLGIYDTVGNVREMVDGFFRLSIADMRNGVVERRLHGAAGGILTKGGSFRSFADGVLPGWRDELPLYTSQGASRPADLGFRVVLAGLNIPNAQRLEILKQEAQAQPESTPKVAGAATPLEALDTLAEHTEGELKNSLEHIRALLVDQQNAQSNADAKNLEHSFRSMLYQAETLRAFALRYSVASKQEEKIRQLITPGMDSSNKAKVEKLLKMAESDLEDYLQSLKMGASYYLSGLEVLCNNPEKETDKLFAQAREEYGGKNIFDEHMRQNLATLQKYLAMARSHGNLNSKTILQGILPEQHFKQLPL